MTDLLDVLKRFHGSSIETPSNRSARPDPDRLASRFERFLVSG